ncbi:MAG: ATP-dependent DNA helicase RecG [Clostridia bacterium]|nr:ATP-dependent DNA helicase RecG [Clostridia bacterium]
MKLKDVKYVSDKRIQDLKKLSINTAEDLINHFPRNYLDLTSVTPLSQAYNNDFVLTLATVEVEPRQASGGRVKYVKALCSQGADTFSVVWFNQPYVVGKLKSGERYFFYGRVQIKYGMISMTNPVFEPVDKNVRLKGYMPVYTVKGNLTQSGMKTICLSAVNSLNPSSSIPLYLQQKYALSPLNKAYLEVHSPSSENALKNASDRIALEEYFKLISAFKIIKGDKKQVKPRNYSISADKLAEFAKRFPFEFTKGQKQAVNEIFTDLKSPFTMNRLLQGDVGSGKTAVSLCALYVALYSGYQCALLSPTEVLAKQNYAVCKKYLKEYEIGYLSGSLTATEKKSIKAKLLSGEIKLLVGTHAVLQENVEFENLALCVCDEQQRFGVAQRNSLEEKGIYTDTLVMSATPIPRTLSLIFYGDLDISTILDKPVGRTEIQTSVVPLRKYEDMLGFVTEQAKKGFQTYFVCPKIEFDDESDVLSAKELYEELSTVLSGVKVGLLHGKMKDKEKLSVMQDFKDKKFDVLVSTTVIEVGVDVPDATVMVIMSAERFGLSQLHQLRGRVGRSDKKSYCFLLCTKESEKAIERLSALKTCSDGFKISEIDFDMRGGGDLLGERQSGRILTTLKGLKYSNKTVFTAKALSDEAFKLESNIPYLKKHALELYEKLKNVTLN